MSMEGQKLIDILSKFTFKLSNYHVTWNFNQKKKKKIILKKVRQYFVDLI
jgi:hypothetical protein